MRGLLVRLALQHQFVNASIELRLNVGDVLGQVSLDVGDLLRRGLGRVINCFVDVDAHLHLRVNYVFLALREVIKLGLNVSRQIADVCFDASNLGCCLRGCIGDGRVEVRAHFYLSGNNVFLALSQRVKFSFDVSSHARQCSCQRCVCNQVFCGGVNCS